jgi:hypothetical protein
LTFEGAQNSTGQSYNHWFFQTVSFSMIIHVIVSKLLLETVYWHWISLVSGIVSIFLYYITILMGNVSAISYIF